MTAYPFGFRLAQAIGISGAAWLSGMYSLLLSLTRNPRAAFMELHIITVPKILSLLTLTTTGNIAALSMNATPALLRSRREDNVPPATLAKQWRNIFENGKTQNPPVAAAVAASFFYLAWSVRAGGPLFKQTAYSRAGLFSTAAVLTLGIVPYTMLAMTSTNNALLEKVKSAPEVSDKETARLIEKWTTLNALRGYLPLAGAAVGIVASFL